MCSRVGSLFLVLSLLSGGAAHADEPAAKRAIPAITDAEARYFKMRDKLCLSQEVKESDYRPLEALRQPTLEFVGPVRVDGFEGEGALSSEPGEDGENPCDYLDGLTYSSSNQTLDITTTAFLVNFLQRHAHAPTSMEDLYGVTSSPNDPTTFAVIPVQKRKGQDYAYATLYGTFSDSGPYLPDHISVIVWVGNRRFTLSGAAKEKAAEIPECSELWKKYAARIDEANEIYRKATSNGKEIQDVALDKKLSNAPEHIREQGAAAFRACYRKLAQERTLFTPFIEQAQSMVDSVHTD